MDLLSGSTRSTKRTSCDEQQLIFVWYQCQWEHTQRTTLPSITTKKRHNLQSISILFIWMHRDCCVLCSWYRAGTSDRKMHPHARASNKQHLLRRTTSTISICENSMFMIFGDLVARRRMCYTPMHNIWVTKAIHILFNTWRAAVYNSLKIWQQTESLFAAID